MAWLYLLLASIFEIGFASSIKLIDGHRNIAWTIFFYLCIILSCYFLELATRQIPISTAYAVWTGVGGVGVTIIGILYLGEPVSIYKIFFILMLITALIGLKITT